MIAASHEKIALRRAVPDDRMRIYHWIARNDLWLTMTGNAPVYEPRIPTFDEFRARYDDNCFTGRQPFLGRVLIIGNGEEDVGFVAFRGVDLVANVVELDAWLAARRFQRRGYGSAAIALACGWLQREFGVDRFVLRPSRRNVHALRAARRAGFREINMDTRQLIEKLRLPPGEDADEVVLLHAPSPPPATLVLDPARTYVFLDTEFTCLDRPALISVGAVATDANAFYCELQGWPAGDASEFVRRTVLPLLDGDAVPLWIAREAFVKWLAQRTATKPVTIVSDSGFDRRTLIDLLGAEDLPENVAWQRVPVAYEHLDAVVAALGLRRHHALDDARALRHTLLAARSQPQAAAG